MLTDITPTPSIDIPPFLVATETRPDPSPALLTILRLTPNEAQRLWETSVARLPALAATMPAIPNAAPEDLPKALLLAAIRSNTDQASMILTISREQDPTAIHIMETMIGKPITRPTPRAPSTAKLKNAKPPRIPTPKALKYDPTHIIHILVPANPKKKGSEPHRRFEIYKSGMSAGEATSLGVLPADIVWDRDHGFIKLEPAT
jgi:hypothetical protein